MYISFMVVDRKHYATHEELTRATMTSVERKCESPAARQMSLSWLSRAEEVLSSPSMTCSLSMARALQANTTAIHKTHYTCVTWVAMHMPCSFFLNQIFCYYSRKPKIPITMNASHCNDIFNWLW